MVQLATVFKKNSKVELNKIKVITTGESGIVEMTVRNTSDQVINNPKIDPPLGVRILEPRKFPVSLKPGDSFNAKIEIDGIISFNEKLRFTYDFMKIEEL